MNARDRFWFELRQLKVHACYLDLYLGKTERVDRVVNFAIAITSTGSLGIWAFLKAYDMVWAGIIVLSQVVAVAKGFLPYRQRVKALASCVHEHEEHMVWAEGKLFDVNGGNLSERDIENLRTDLQKRAAKTMKHCFPLSTLPDDKALFDEATIRADAYLNSFYGSDADEPANEVSDEASANTSTP